MTEGIILNLPEGSDTRLSTEAFELISELRILLINSAIFGNCDFRHFPASLKWLEWKGCPLETLPLESKFISVVVLNLSRSFIGQLWSETTSCSKSTKELYEGLKVLDLSCCDCLKCTPNFAVAPNLKKLILDECSNLKEVDDSIGFLKKLVFLSMRECVSLEKLPNKIYELSSLAVFNLEGCHRLVAFPQFLAGSDSAVDLHRVANNQPTSRQPTNFINGLSNLEELILRDCESLEFLPRLHEFHSLRSLHIDGCPGLNHIRKYLFENVAVREWDELSVSGSETQSSKQEFSFMLPIGSINDPLLLQQLQCHGYGDPCEKGTMALLVRYEDMANNWLNLGTILEARCDYSMYEDNVYGYCYTICFGRNDQINESPRGETVIMKVSTVNNCKLTKVDIKLQKSSRFSGENMMKPYISISRREAFMSPPTSVNPSSSRKFEFEISTFFSAYQVDKLEVIEYPAMLDDRLSQMMRRLHAQCGELFYFGWTIEELIILTFIFGDTKASWYEQWHGTVLPRQARDMVYDKMKVLDVSHCWFLVRTPDFARTPNLEKLILDHCGSLLEIDESIGQLKKLVLLNITRCAKLLALPCAILQLHSLRVLSLEGCSAITFLPEDSMMHVGLETLEELVLDYCTSLRRIPYYVGGLQCLRRLSLRGCYSLASLPLSIGSLVVLEELNVAECAELFSIPGLEKLRSLKVLHMNGCDLLDLEQIHRQLKVFQDLEAFSISIATWNVANTSFLSPINSGKSNGISFPFPRGRRVGREPLYVERINVAIGGTLDYGRINLEIKTTEGNVRHVDALPVGEDRTLDYGRINLEIETTEENVLHCDALPEKGFGFSEIVASLVMTPTLVDSVNCLHEALFRMDDEVNECLRVEAAASADDATSVGMMHVSCTEPSFWLQRGDIWFRQPLIPKIRGLLSPEDTGMASKKPKIEGSPYFVHSR